MIMGKTKGKKARIRVDAILATLGKKEKIDITPCTLAEAQMIAEHSGGGAVRVERPKLEKCEGKLIYKTKSLAETVKRNRKKTSTGNAGRLCSYKCNICNGYHLTSTR